MRCQPAEEAIALQRCPVSSLFFSLSRSVVLFLQPLSVRPAVLLASRCLASAVGGVLVARKKELQGEITTCSLDVARD